MYNNIYIATWDNGFFGSAGQSWLSLNVKNIAEYILPLAEQVTCVCITDLQTLELDSNDVVIYCSSDEENMRSYLIDVMFFIEKKCKIIPNYTALLAHENKGFQQLMRSEFGFGNLAGDYNFDLDKIKREKPYVFKKITGAGSSGVSLIKKYQDENAVKSKFFDVGLKRKLIKFQRKLKLTASEYGLYSYRHKGFALAVTQDFIKDLKCDYKVLIFGHKYFVLRRDVRKNDFRASGSGKLIFEEVPNVVLDFAKKVFEQLNEPYASLDIAISGKQAHLIEYQILNFGPYALKSSPGYYEFDSIWKYKNTKSNLESCFGSALATYIKKLL